MLDRKNVTKAKEEISYFEPRRKKYILLQKVSLILKSPQVAVCHRTVLWVKNFCNTEESGKRVIDLCPFDRQRVFIAYVGAV